MDTQTIRLVTRNYDVLTPMLADDVAPEGIDLRSDRDSSIGAFHTDTSLDAGEMSFSGYVRQLDAGRSDIVGLPIFIMRGFRQRCFFVKRGSDLTSLGDLAGKRIGTNGWPDSGNTWSRSLLRAEGVDIGGIDWFVGPIDGVTDQAFGHRFSNEGFPDNVQPVPEGQSLVGMLVAGNLDAMMVPWPPRGFYDPDAPVVRLLSDYRSAEEEYARRVGFCPGHHVIGVRAGILEDNPWIARSLFEAFEESRELAEERRWMLADTSPWLLPDLERTTEILGPDWQINGVEPNRAMINTFANELHAQGIVRQQFEAFEESRKLAEERRWMLADTSPWLLPDLERTTEILGPNWQINGVEPNRAMIDTFANELHAQGIVGQRFKADEIFSEFLNLPSIKS